MSIFAVADSAGLIINRIMLDSAEQWQEEDGLSIVEERDEPFLIGGTYIDGRYTPPVVEPAPAPRQPVLTPIEKLAAAGLTPADLRAILTQ